MDAFKIPGECTMQTPFADLHLWQWAQAQPRDKVTVHEYLSSLGFVVGVHRLSEEQYDTLDSACDLYQRTAPHMPGPRRFADLFAPVLTGGYWVSGKPGRWNPCAELVAALVSSGWVYEVNPETTYFEVVTSTGLLWAKYQQILGSRPMVQLSE